MSITTRVFRPILMLLALVAAGIGQTQTEPPRVRHVQVGIGGQFRNRHWTPVAVDVENTGPARTGQLVVELDGNLSGQRLEFIRPVTLPANSYRRFEFPVFPDAPNPLGVKRSMERVVQVKLTDGGLQVWSRNEGLGHKVAEDAVFLLVCDTTFAGYRGLREVPIGAEKRMLSKAQVQPKNLPRRPLDLRGFDAVVLGGLADYAPTPLQLQALHDFVAQGGHLIVVPSAAPGISPALAEQLPGTFLSPQRLETLPPLTGEFIFTNGLATSRLVPGTGEVTVGTRDRPWAISRTVGAGRVTMLGFEAGSEEFSVWPGSTNFWRELLAPPQFLHHADRLMARSVAAERVLAGLSGMKVVSRQWVLVYLLSASGLVLLALIAFRFTSKPERGWAIATPVALCLGVGAVVMAARWKTSPQPLLNEVYLATARSGEDGACVQAALGVYSPTEQSYDLLTATDAASLLPGRSGVNPPEVFRLGYENQIAVSNLAVRADDLRTLIGRAPQPALRAPTVHTRISTDGLSVTISNRTEVALAEPFLKFNRFVVPLPTIAPGARLEHHATNQHLSATAPLVRSARQEQRDRVSRIFFPEPVYSGDVKVSFDELRFNRLLRGRELLPALFSWSDRPAFPITAVHPAVTRDAIGLLAVEGSVEYQGPSLLLPRGVMPLQIQNMGAYLFLRGEGCFAGGRAGNLAIEFSLPAGCPDLVAQELTLHFEYRGTAFEPEVFIGPGGVSVPEDTRTALQPGLTKLTGPMPARVPNPERLLRPGQRSVVVVLRVNASAEGKRIGFMSNPDLHVWQIRNLDLELKGTIP